MKLLAELLYKYGGFVVASHAEAWIEILERETEKSLREVASHAEAWIEIYRFLRIHLYGKVASHAEAWIEIYRFLRIHLYGKVASHAEAWIEIGPQNRSQISAQSPPTRRRGLKL